MNKLPHIEKAGNEHINFHRGRRASSAILLYGYMVATAIFFLVLISRLFQLTIVKGAYYRRLSEENRIREVIIEPKRGTIIDRKGAVLVQNTAADIQAEGMRLASPRRYFSPEAFAHLIGYRQPADDKDIDHDPCVQKLKVGDKIGKKAIEKSYECQLRGVHGKKLIEVSAEGKPVRTLSILPPQDGDMIQLAADANLQEKAYSLIKDTRAVVVGIQPKTGEVLVMTSSPSYNPQHFEDGASTELSSYFSNTDKPLFNRATEGTYPPGSTFKLVLAAGALEDKDIDEHTVIEDTGIIQAGAHTFGTWNFLEHGKTEGDVDLVKAIRRSNDIFFYKLGEKMGPIKIKSWAEIFGYGKKHELMLDESEGTIPSPFWKEDTLKEKWYLGDTYNLSIGQGYLLTTPLQVALMTSVFANDGSLCKPQLLKTSQSQAQCKKLPISEKTIHLIQQGMREACAPGGTGWPFFEFKVKNSQSKDETIKVACKTGTAESHGEKTKPHAWFTIYAPSESPQIVLTVLIEEAGQGSDIAAPIAKAVLTQFFERSQ